MKFVHKEEMRKRKKKSDERYLEFQKRRQERDKENQIKLSERKKQEIEFRNKIDARGILSKEEAKKQTEISTLQYLAKSDTKMATRKIKAYPIIMFSTKKIFHCDRLVEEMQIVGVYYDPKDEKNQNKVDKQEESKKREQAEAKDEGR